jgi:hypothetical protein
MYQMESKMESNETETRVNKRPVSSTLAGDFDQKPKGNTEHTLHRRSLVQIRLAISSNGRRHVVCAVPYPPMGHVFHCPAVNDAEFPVVSTLPRLFAEISMISAIPRYLLS